MPFWDKFFGDSRKREEENTDEQPVPQGPWERFAHNFTQNNGKFLLAHSDDEIKELLQKILDYENADEFWAYEQTIKSRYLQHLPHSDSSQPRPDHIFLGNARYLLENAGGILFTSYETGDFRLIDLPRTMVFLAEPDRLVPSKEKAMEHINSALRNAYPAHIHSIKNFSPRGNDFSKNVYLILKA